MYCSIISATDKYTLWGIETRKNWNDSLACGFNGLFDIAAVGDTILLNATDKFGYLEITALNASDRSVSVEVKDVKEWRNNDD